MKLLPVGSSLLYRKLFRLWCSEYFFSITPLEKVFITYLFLCRVLCEDGGLGCCAVNRIQEQTQLEALSLPLSFS